MSEKLIDQLILKKNHVVTQSFQCRSEGRNIFFDCFHQLLHLFFQFTQEFVICPDLAVQFAAVRNN